MFLSVCLFVASNIVAIVRYNMKNSCQLLLLLIACSFQQSHHNSPVQSCCSAPHTAVQYITQQNGHKSLQVETITLHYDTVDVPI
mmetsp:Transcript_54289/g.131719  ORF Transcript_54289/g.131719 Transcript_54289/m.131719 type:complete len:85 (+) Transcript_54289:81-335(+)